MVSGQVQLSKSPSVSLSLPTYLLLTYLLILFIFIVRVYVCSMYRFLLSSVSFHSSFKSKLLLFLLLLNLLLVSSLTPFLCSSQVVMSRTSYV